MGQLSIGIFKVRQPGQVQKLSGKMELFHK